MKKLIIGTVTALTVIGATAASAQTRTERNWFDLSAVQLQQGQFSENPNANFAPDSVK